MQGLRDPRVKRVRANLVRVDAKSLKSELGCVKAQEEDGMVAGNGVCGGGRFGIVIVDWGVRVGEKKL